MTTDPPPAIDQRLVRALAHPNRIAILDALVDEQGLGLIQISEQLMVKPANVNYHLTVLIESGVIEAVPTPPGKSAPERLFRLTPRSPIGSQRWGDISESMRGEISTALLQNLVSEARTFPRSYDGRDA